MAQTAALLFALLLLALGAFQLALASGAPLGRFAWGGQHRILPRALRIGSLVSILLYGLMALVVLDRAALLPVLPAAARGIAIWLVAGYMALGTLVNLISRSVPERLLMTPLALVLCLLCLAVALA